MTTGSTVPTAARADLTAAPERLHHLDRLRVALILGVFAYHALHPFDETIDWHIKNDEQSIVVMLVLILVIPWGLPLFFLVAGASSRFSLRHRSSRRFVAERVARLAVPYVVGSIVLTPIQLYLEARHKDTYDGSFVGFLPEMIADLVPSTWNVPLVLTQWGRTCGSSPSCSCTR